MLPDPKQQLRTPGPDPGYPGFKFPSNREGHMMEVKESRGPAVQNNVQIARHRKWGFRSGKTLPIHKTLPRKTTFIIDLLNLIHKNVPAVNTEFVSNAIATLVAGYEDAIQLIIDDCIPHRDRCSQPSRAFRAGPTKTPAAEQHLFNSQVSAVPVPVPTGAIARISGRPSALTNQAAVMNGERQGKKSKRLDRWVPIGKRLTADRR
ncbi:hypothetical protein HOY80DRAFT_1052483 [Tuber brumale]|nr:hypothetical protein HOY80DRAFT_1052483 [Tuber brumale]